MAQPPGPLSPLDHVLEDFKKDLTAEELKSFDGVTLRNLKEKLAGLQQQQKARKTMQNLTRIQGFIDAMEQYSKVLDVFVNVHNFVAFIWGPMKFLLLTASTLSEAFNGLLDAYKRIGERLPLLEQYQLLIGSDPRVQEVLKLTFRDIFDFHREALKCFRKSGWKLLFHATWNGFKTTFAAILGSLEHHKQLLVDHASVHHFRQAQEEILQAAEARRVAEARYKERQDKDRIEKMKHLDTWLGAADIHMDHERLARIRTEQPGSCHWILQKDLYHAWYDMTTTCEPLLWINGIPGAGKSVLASFIIEETLKLPNTKVLFFYCRHEDPLRNTFVAMARAFIWELVQHNEDIADIVFEMSVRSTERSQLRTQKRAGEVLDAIVQSAGRLCITLDGLDECPETEQQHIATWLKKFVNTPSAIREPSRCVVLSQHDRKTRSLMSKLPTLRISTQDNRADIEAYCKTRSTELQQSFPLDALQADAIGAKTASHAEGMFLFARLVMRHLSEQTNLRDLHEEVRQILDVSQNKGPIVDSPGNSIFQKLDTAYSRILRRIVDKASGPSKRDASQLLGWLVCALRPLTWQEIQTALSIDTDEGTVDPARRRIVDAKDLCGSLIDIGPHGQIDLVHSTAKVYLEKAGYVYPPDEHLALANLCIAQFCFPMYESTLSDQELDQYLLQGSYGLFDYATTSWTTHMELGLKTRSHGRDPTSDQLDAFEEDLESFLSLHYQEAEEKSHVPQHFFQPVRTLRNENLHDRALATMASMYKLIKSPEVLDVEQVSTLKLTSLLFRTRGRMEHLIDADLGDNYLRLSGHYGSNLYKCPRLCCKWFHEGFDSLEKRQTHVEKHARSFHCPHSGCASAALGWATKRELDGHIDAYHKKDDEFPSEDETSDKSGSANAQKTPKKLQCHLCPKNFTRAHNLRAHLRTHGNERPFECSTCEKAFARDHDLKRHSRIHSGEMKFLCGGVLQDGSKWGCGRRFTRAEGLNSHFRSGTTGRICIEPKLREDEKQREDTSPAAPERLPYQPLSMYSDDFL